MTQAVLSSRPEFDITSAMAGAGGGWIMLDGRLWRDGWDLSARLLAFDQHDALLAAIPLPITLKGTLLELVKLPAGTRRLVLEPLGAGGEARIEALSVMPVSRLRRWYRMGRRVLHVYYRQPRRRLRQAGMGWLTPFLDLPRAYALAGRFRASAVQMPYADWVREFDTLTERDRRQLRKRWPRLREAESLPPGPGGERVQVVVPVVPATEPAALAATLASLGRQLITEFRVVLLVAEGNQAGFHLATQALRDAGCPGHVGLALPSPEQSAGWSLWLPPGCVPAEHGLFSWLHAAAGHAQAELIYSDHDHLAHDLAKRGERHAPVFKPDANQELLRATAYLGAAWLVRSQRLGHIAAAQLLGSSEHRLQLMLAHGLGAAQLVHVPAVLWHRQVDEPLAQPWPQVSSGEVQAVEAALTAKGVNARVTPTVRGHCRVHYALPSAVPKVSIIVPTRDGLDLLRPCIESVLEKSTYADYEVLIVDNQSAEAETLAWFDAITLDPRVKVIRFDAPFNFSGINNAAARQAQGEVLCLLNNDTQVISPGWLEEMVSRLLQPRVGVVGAKLYYADGRVQHAGDAVGPGGLADHLHSRLPGDAPGHCDRAVLAQALSAVTAACLVTRRELYAQLGGLNEADLAVAFNDVDYCLRVREAGWQVHFTPYAELYHLESVSRGKDDSPEKQARAAAEAAYMRKRWAHVLEHDPFYNPNLNYRRPDFTLGHAPRVETPWRK